MSTQTEVEVSYGVSNDFFQLWLDEKMNYTCGLYDKTDNLEEAQMKKLARLSRLAGIGPHTESVLDIGCGWGANIEYQAIVNKVPDVHGFTLSPAQHAFCLSRKIPNTTATCENYLEYKAPRKFDAVMSICMIEHVVRPEDARAGRAVELYRDYFRRAHSWTKPGTKFGLQAITRCNVPRTKQELDDLRHSTYTIFPGAVTPRVEDIIVAANPYYEVMEMYSMRDDYKKTTQEWLNRLERNEAKVLQKWGKQVYGDYVRYLSTCVKAFEKNWQSLHQFSLRRLDHN
jgi:cyclopropane-fatty-acyl-phospholipid synthase